MCVPRQHISAFDRLRVVAQRQRPEAQRFADGVDAESLRRITGVQIMVAAHQRQAKSGVPLAPACQRIERCVGARTRGMQKVAEEDEALGSRCVDRGRKRGQRLGGRAARHRHAEPTKRHRLADVGVGNQQRGVIGEEHRPLGHQLQPLAGQCQLERPSHGLSRRVAKARRRGARWAGA